MNHISKDSTMAQRMGVLARMHVKRKFSRKAFGERFQSIFQSDIKKHDASATFLLSCAVTVLFILKLPFFLWLSCQR
jgi:hypothetical protein